MKVPEDEMRLKHVSLISQDREKKPKPFVMVEELMELIRVS